MIRTLEDGMHKLQLEMQDVYQDGAEGRHLKCSENSPEAQTSMAC